MTELRIGQVELQPPQERAGDPPVTAWVARVLEPDPPAGQEPPEWLLVSSEEGDGGMGGANRGLVRGEVGDRGVFPGA